MVRGYEKPRKNLIINRIDIADSKLPIFTGQNGKNNYGHIDSKYRIRTPYNNLSRLNEYKKTFYLNVLDWKV